MLYITTITILLIIIIAIKINSNERTNLGASQRVLLSKTIQQICRKTSTKEH